MLTDARMRLISESVREGVTVCDVGTDHAHIPIELIKSGKAKRCIITDISAPSLEKGVRNAKDAGCIDKISPYCANGTLGVPLDGQTDFIIAGMGGELISEIIAQDKRLRNGEYRFVLQPMSKAEVLREFLAENGFKMTEEKKVESAGRVYAVILCRFTDEKITLTEREKYLGVSHSASDPLALEYARRTVSSLKTRLTGLMNAEDKDEKEIEALKKKIEILN